jgi:hypothetical protein
VNRRWPPVVAAALAVSGCGGGHTDRTREALSYAAAYYRSTMDRLDWPRYTPVARLAVRASCRTVRSRYELPDPERFARRLAPSLVEANERHDVQLARAELLRACVSGIRRLTP